MIPDRRNSTNAIEQFCNIVTLTIAFLNLLIEQAILIQQLEKLEKYSGKP